MSNPNCGIVMPISPMEDCDTQHWQDVKLILEEAIDAAGYAPRLVSLSDKVSIIHQSIVTNLYEDEIVVCDVSCRNGNVMFELGLRLAFDKPVIIVKDDKTDYLFDTGPIEHMIYPRTLRFGQINKFKTDLTKKIKATTEHHKKHPDASPFLASFGPIKTAKIETTEVSPQDLFIDYLDRISSRLDSLETSFVGSSRKTMHTRKPGINLKVKIPGDISESDINRMAQVFRKISSVEEYRFYKENDTLYADVKVRNSTNGSIASIQRAIAETILDDVDIMVSEIIVE